MKLDIKTHLNSFAIGAFFSTYIYLSDRAINIKGPVNITVQVLMSVFCLLVALSMRKVPEGSMYHRPFKWLSAIAGFALVLTGIYAVAGGLPGHPNFLLMLATTDQVPEVVRKACQQLAAWSSQHFYAGVAAKTSAP